MKALELIYPARVNSKGKVLDLQRLKFDYEVGNYFACQDIEIVVRKKREIRKLPSNNYYFGVLVKDIQARLWQLGNDWSLKQVHDYLKNNFLPENIDIDWDTGELILNENSTAQCTGEEFSTYIDRIIAWAAEFLEIEILYPEEHKKSVNDRWKS